MAVGALALFGVFFLWVFIVRSVIQKRRTGDSGIRSGMLRAKLLSAEGLAGWMLVLAFVAAVGAPVAELGGLSPLTTNRLVRGAGASLAVIGIVFTVVSQIDMGAQWRVGVDTREKTELVRTGAFRFVRNPIFTAMVAVAGGLALMVPNPISIAGILLFVAAIQLQVRFVEEPYLRETHGSAYTSFTAQVGRFVPRLGRTRVQ